MGFYAENKVANASLCRCTYSIKLRVEGENSISVEAKKRRLGRVKLC